MRHLHLDKAKEATFFRVVHDGLCGPVTPRGRRYFLLLVDDLSCYMWVVLLDMKSATVDTIKQLQAAADKECGRKL